MGTQTITETETVEETKEQNKIVVFNDDVNSFDHVIACFVQLCDHEPHQAEQCALIIHNNGKCEVKSGELDDLIPICSALLDNQLSATIE